MKGFTMGSSDDVEFNWFKIIAVLLFWVIAHLVGSGTKQRVPRPRDQPESKPRAPSKLDEEAERALKEWREIFGGEDESEDLEELEAKPVQVVIQQDVKPPQEAVEKRRDESTHHFSTVEERTLESSIEKRTIQPTIEKRKLDIALDEDFSFHSGLDDRIYSSTAVLQSAMKKEKNKEKAQRIGSKKQLLLAYEIMQAPVSLRRPRI